MGADQLSPQQQDALRQLRDELEQDAVFRPGDSLGRDDASLLRFLRARSFDVKQSKEQIRDCLQWRRSCEGVGIDELYRSLDPYQYPEREDVFKCWPMWFHKTDRKGRPLNVHFFGGINMPELYKSVSPERHWQTVLVNAESLTREVLPAASASAEKHIDQTLVVVDLKGFGLQQFWQMKGLVRRSFQISQDYYPETMGQLAIINAPLSFTAIWAAVKPWLSAETCEKISILGSNYQAVLLDLVPAENLPASLGGQCTCEHAGGCHLSGAGPWMDGRKERREKWLSGEGDSPGVQWQPQPPSELPDESKLEGPTDGDDQRPKQNGFLGSMPAANAEVAA